MNQVITDGLDLMPPAFSDGLDAWSREDGTPGTDTWASASNAALVAADADFGDCLEIVKTDSVTQLRYMGQTPILPGTYLRVSARLKVLSGNLPEARVAGWPGDATDTLVGGLTVTGPSVSPSPPMAMLSPYRPSSGPARAAASTWPGATRRSTGISGSTSLGPIPDR
jgi:hypothetical protein